MMNGTTDGRTDPLIEMRETHRKRKRMNEFLESVSRRRDAINEKVNAVGWSGRGFRGVMGIRGY